MVKKLTYVINYVSLFSWFMWKTMFYCTNQKPSYHCHEEEMIICKYFAKKYLLNDDE